MNDSSLPPPASSTPAPVAPKAPKARLELHWQILIALVLAVALGSVADATTADGVLLGALEFVGTFFLRLLKMLVLPLIFSSIIVGVAGVERGHSVGRMGAYTGLLYAGTSLVAIVVGLTFVSIIQPGIVDGEPARDLVGLTHDVDQVIDKVEGKGAKDIMGIFLRMIPENILDDAANGEMLSVIVFALLFGMAMSKIEERPREILVGFFRGVDAVMLRITDLVLKVSPLGVFGLVGKVALTTGWDAVAPLLVFFVTVVLALMTHAFVVIPLLLLVVARFNPLQHYRALAPALLMAFSTASSSGTLPVTMEQVHRLGVSRRVASFTLPLGATVNMDGTALYECVAAVFIAQAYGVQLGFTKLFLVALVALLTSVGVAGIPAASLVAISLILTAMGLPLEGLGLILAVDRLLDMCRTSVNVLGDSAVAVCVARLTGESLEPVPESQLFRVASHHDANR